MEATIIGGPSSTKNADKTRDPETHHTGKGQQWYLGMKMHIGVDSRAGLHVFAVVKRLWGFAEVRYRGLDKNANRSLAALGLANLYLACARLPG